MEISYIDQNIQDIRRVSSMQVRKNGIAIFLHETLTRNLVGYISPINHSLFIERHSPGLRLVHVPCAVTKSYTGHRSLSLPAV